MRRPGMQVSNKRCNQEGLGFAGVGETAEAEMSGEPEGGDGVAVK